MPPLAELPKSRIEIEGVQSARRKRAVEQARRAPFYKGKLDHVNLDRLDDPDEWRKLPILDKDMLRRLEVPERTAVIRRGKVGDCMYFIADGEAEVDVKPTPVRLATGSFFGELALLGDSVRSANVVTTQPSTLLILDLADFRTLTAHHPELARAIDAEGKRRMSENKRLRELQEQSGASPSG